MSGAAISSTMERSQVLPQNLSNQRPTMALLSFSLDITFPFVRTDTDLFLATALCSAGHVLTHERTSKTPFHDFKFRHVPSQITTSGENDSCCCFQRWTAAAAAVATIPARRICLSLAKGI